MPFQPGCQILLTSFHCRSNSKVKSLRRKNRDDAEPQGMHPPLWVLISSSLKAQRVHGAAEITQWGCYPDGGLCCVCRSPWPTLWVTLAIPECSERLAARFVGTACGRHPVDSFLLLRCLNRLYSPEPDARWAGCEPEDRFPLPSVPVGSGRGHAACQTSTRGPGVTLRDTAHSEAWPPRPARHPVRGSWRLRRRESRAPGRVLCCSRSHGRAARGRASGGGLRPKALARQIQGHGAGTFPFQKVTSVFLTVFCLFNRVWLTGLAVVKGHVCPSVVWRHLCNSVRGHLTPTLTAE